MADPVITPWMAGRVSEKKRDNNYWDATNRWEEMGSKGRAPTWRESQGWTDRSAAGSGRASRFNFQTGQTYSFRDPALGSRGRGREGGGRGRSPGNVGRSANTGRGAYSRGSDLGGQRVGGSGRSGAPGVSQRGGAYGRGGAAGAAQRASAAAGSAAKLESLSVVAGATPGSALVRQANGQRAGDGRMLAGLQRSYERFVSQGYAPMEAQRKALLQLNRWRDGKDASAEAQREKGQGRSWKGREAPGIPMAARMKQQIPRGGMKGGGPKIGAAPAAPAFALQHPRAGISPSTTPRTRKRR